MINADDARPPPKKPAIVLSLSSEDKVASAHGHMRHPFSFPFFPLKKGYRRWDDHERVNGKVLADLGRERAAQERKATNGQHEVSPKHPFLIHQRLPND